MTHRARLSVFAVEDDAAQVVATGPDGVRSHDVTGLLPAATQQVTVDGMPLTVTTLAPPPGRVLSRIEPFPLRCARAAVREARAWGAEAIVFKGDLTQHGRADEFAQLAELLDTIDVPVGLLLGNHDHRGAAHGLDARKSLADIGHPFDDVSCLDVPGATVILVDTTVPGRQAGRVHHSHEHAVTTARAATGPVVVMLHHHLQPWPIPTAYPFGVPSGPAGRFLRDLRGANPAVFVTSGHSHRHHAYRRHGVTLTQVGSVKDYPGVWAGYVIHEGGIRQVVRRIADPDCLAWNQRTARAIWGLWGHWTPGRLSDRCLTHHWA
jgi:Icc protein